MKRIKTLVIDDDELMLFLFRIMIDDMRSVWDADYFPHAQQALNYLELKKSKDLHFLIFLDLYMPGISGWQMLDQLKVHPCKDKVSVVIVSSSFSKEDREKAKQYDQIKDYIVKPFLTQKLLDLAKNPALSSFF